MKLTAILPIFDDAVLAQDLQIISRAFAGKDIHLIGLFISPPEEQLYSVAPYTAAAYAISKDVLAERRAKLQTVIKSCEQTFGALQLPAGSTSEWREQEGLASQVLSEHVLFADIVILMGRTSAIDRQDLGFDYNADLLSHLITKTPVSALLLPEEGLAHPVFSAPLLAWKASPESAAAVRTASRILPSETKVMLATVAKPPVADAAFGSWSAAEITRYLQRAGLEVEEQVIALRSGSVAQALRQAADLKDASLIVAGGYGRQKWLETLLGGVTRELVANSRLPLLFAH